jgi:hypothetical protein
MEWQAVVLAVQIMLLAAGWLLFQRARGELSARAAETPVLAEVRALQKSVKLLLAEIDAAADRQAQRLENGCAEAATLAAELESRTAEADRLLEDLERQAQASRSPANIATRSQYTGGVGQGGSAGPGTVQGIEAIVSNRGNQTDASTAAAVRRARIFELADSGQSIDSIAHATQVSKGEIETLLGLRSAR